MKVRKKRIVGKIPFGKWGANVLLKNGQKGIIHTGQINFEGKYWVYSVKNEFEPKIEEFEIINYF